jgi:hypothetical protein
VRGLFLFGGEVYTLGFIIAALLDVFSVGQAKYIWINIAIHAIFFLWLSYFAFKRTN